MILPKVIKEIATAHSTQRTVANDAGEETKRNTNRMTVCNLATCKAICYS